MRQQLKAQDLVLATLAAAVWVTVFRPGPLDLPYFWDEADVYVPGARWIAEHGMSFSPADFSGDYSRGHPPLFYLIAALAFSAFGTSPLVGHLVVLPFTVATLVGTYVLGVRLWDRRVGAAAAMLLGSTPIFLSMGNMLLPEMPLTAACVWGFVALSGGRLGWAAVAGIFGVLLKETGLAAAGAVGIVVLFDAWERGTLRSTITVRRASVAALPLFALLAFFVWQKITVGYFVFPHHVDLLAARPFGPSSLFTIFPSLLLLHGRWVPSLAAILAAWLGWQAIRPTLSPVAPSHHRPSRRAMLLGFGALVLFNAVFFAKMFWLERYVLPAHPPVLLVASFLLVVGLDHLPILAALPAAVGIAMGLGSLWAPSGPDQEELTFGYAHVVATHRQAFLAIEGDAPEVLTTWPMTVELENTYLGYVERPVRSTNIRYLDAQDPPAFTHVLISIASPRAEDLRAEADARSMSSLGVFQVGHAPRLELYGR